MPKKIRQCVASTNLGLDRCSRRAVVSVVGHDYCKQHAIKKLPHIRIILGTDNQEGLKRNLIEEMFKNDRPKGVKSGDTR